jgi:hypothetical protein
MAKKKTAKKKTGWVPMTERPVMTGVGFNPKEVAACVVMSHPIYGMTVFGPFFNRDTARKWASEEGMGEAYFNYDSESAAAEFHVITMDVPRKEVQ